jgi:hypothetical protein
MKSKVEGWFEEGKNVIMQNIVLKDPICYLVIT